MRLANAQGGLEFSFKDALDDPMPEGFKPWFEYPSLAAQTHQIVFGHWAALQGTNGSRQYSKCGWRLCVGQSAYGLSFGRSAIVCSG